MEWIRAEQGKITESLWYDSNGTSWVCMINKYDDFGNKTEESNYLRGDVLFSAFFYKYDDSCNMIEQVWWNNPGTEDAMILKNTFKYDNYGLIAIFICLPHYPRITASIFTFYNIIFGFISIYYYKIGRAHV